MKQLLKSRTVQVAILMGILGVVESQIGGIQSFITGNFGLNAGTVFSVLFGSVMVVMRVITTQSLSEK